MLFFYFMLSWCFGGGKKIKIFPCETGSVGVLINKTVTNVGSSLLVPHPSTTSTGEAAGVLDTVRRNALSLACFDTGFPLMFFPLSPPL